MDILYHKIPLLKFACRVPICIEIVLDLKSSVCKDKELWLDMEIFVFSKVWDCGDVS